MKSSLFDFDLPAERIAQAPIEPRDHSKLLLCTQSPMGSFQHSHHPFYAVEQILTSNDWLVTNDAKVLPVRLLGARVREGDSSGGGAVEALLTECVSPTESWALVHLSAKIRPGMHFAFEPGLIATVLSDDTERQKSAGEVRLSFSGPGLETRTLTQWLEQHGHVPLPPYVTRTDGPADRKTYQTVYAKAPGSAAAPTAGFHFTNDLLDRLKDKGVDRQSITLHVGTGTFRPLKSETLDQHQMHSERFEISPEFARAFAQNKRKNLVAVGTTVVRALESWVLHCRKVGIEPGSPESAGTFHTDLFIKPGYRFQAVHDLITNFHLPRSTLLVLVSTFMNGNEHMKAAYDVALGSGYRFFSYGDAMMIRRNHA